MKRWGERRWMAGVVDGGDWSHSWMQCIAHTNFYNVATHVTLTTLSLAQHTTTHVNNSPHSCSPPRPRHRHSYSHPYKQQQRMAVTANCHGLHGGISTIVPYTTSPSFVHTQAHPQPPSRTHSTTLLLISPPSCCRCRTMLLHHNIMLISLTFATLLISTARTHTTQPRTCRCVMMR